jgi:methionyl-tRNA synthetase
MPSTALKIRAQINVDEGISAWDNAGKWGLLPENLRVKKGEIIFPRIDLTKELEALENTADPKKVTEDKAEAGLAQISIDDFAKVDLRAAKIIRCEKVEKSRNLLKLTLDDGNGQNRTVASGIAKWYTPEDLVGKTVVLVANLAPAKLMGIESHGMILAADCGKDDVRVVFVDGMPAGSKIR